ncbi:hypothetical protein [Paremcibacter congregatus]|nr:hypothetical protein [Paremcibacter congregatus]
MAAIDEITVTAPTAYAPANRASKIRKELSQSNSVTEAMEGS